MPILGSGSAVLSRSLAKLTLIVATAALAAAATSPLEAQAPAEAPVFPAINVVLERSVELGAGWNQVGWTGDGLEILEALQTFEGEYSAAFGYESGLAAFQSFRLGVPEILNTLSAVDGSDGLWILVTTPGEWIQPTSLQQRSVFLNAGPNLVTWTGPSGMLVEEAVEALGDSFETAFRWDPETQSFLSFQTPDPSLPAFLQQNTLETLDYGDGLWLFMATSRLWVLPEPGGGESVVSADGRFAVTTPAGSSLAVGDLSVRAIAADDPDRSIFFDADPNIRGYEIVVDPSAAAAAEGALVEVALLDRNEVPVGALGEEMTVVADATQLPSPIEVAPSPTLLTCSDGDCRSVGGLGTAQDGGGAAVTVQKQRAQVLWPPFEQRIRARIAIEGLVTTVWGITPSDPSTAWRFELIEPDPLVRQVGSADASFVMRAQLTNTGSAPFQWSLVVGPSSSIGELAPGASNEHFLGSNTCTKAGPVVETFTLWIRRQVGEREVRDSKDPSRVLFTLPVYEERFEHDSAFTVTCIDPATPWMVGSISWELTEPDAGTIGGEPVVGGLLRVRVVSPSGSPAELAAGETLLVSWAHETFASLATHNAADANEVQNGVMERFLILFRTSYQFSVTGLTVRRPGQSDLTITYEKPLSGINWAVGVVP